MEIGLVRPVELNDEMQQAYLDYAMSVIVARALPDARDGLKPVHRRILYAMYDMGLRPESAFKKSARIVGEVLGKYHPHGDMAAYEAMARMAQDFSMRTQLVDGQGNFGSVDGDPPAAMRYTEARLTSPAMQMLVDIDKNTVDFAPNFDDTLREPVVLPSAYPNLLVNGATGIAVGMSTSIPPHNLGEVVDALRFMLDRWDTLDDLPLEDLLKFIKGPDFPTGGIILPSSGEETLASAYGSGRGQFTVQARAHLEELERSRNRIIVTELPYMVNKSSLIERIAELVREDRLTGITDLRDESDRQGMRIVIDLAKTADPEKVLLDLYRYTAMKSTFSLILLALVDGEPRMLSLKQALRVYLDHRLDVIRRRSEFELKRAQERAHLLEGLRIALKNLDEIIDLIRKSADVETARDRLIKRFRLSEIQAQAILDMPLRRLAALERRKIELEYQELQKRIKDLESLLKSPRKMRQVVSDELEKVRQAYADRRRTQITAGASGKASQALLTAADTEPEKTIWVALNESNLVWRTPGTNLPRQSGNDAPYLLVRSGSRDTLYLAMENGECAALPVHTLPEGEEPSGAVPLASISPIKHGAPVAAFTLPPRNERPPGMAVLTTTRLGLLKKSSAADLPGASANLFTLVKVNPADQLGWVSLVGGSDDLLLVSRNGQAIRFNEEEVRIMGLAAAGVAGIKLAAGDALAGVLRVPAAGEIVLIASDGSGKRIPAEEFPRQGRYGQGVSAWKLPDGAIVVGVAAGKGTLKISLFMDRLAAKSLRLDEVPLVKRTARGKPLFESRGIIQVRSVAAPKEAAYPAEKTTPSTRTKAAPAALKSTKAPARDRGKATRTTSKPAKNRPIKLDEENAEQLTLNIPKTRKSKPAPGKS